MALIRLGSLVFALAVAGCGSEFSSGPGSGGGSSGGAGQGGNSAPTGSPSSSAAPSSASSSSSGQGASTGVGTSGVGGAGGGEGGGHVSTGSASSAMSSSASGGQPCPSPHPNHGDSCNMNGQICVYDDDPTCCGLKYTCASGHWNGGVAGNCDSGTGCPSSAPQDGQACSCTAYPLGCDYNGTCSQTGKGEHANCVGQQTWAVSPTTCNGYVACGPGRYCAPNEVCFATSGGAGFTYQCQPNPCGGGPLICGACVQCPGTDVCTVDASMRMVNCTCEVCQ